MGRSEIIIRRLVFKLVLIILSSALMTGLTYAREPLTKLSIKELMEIEVETVQGASKFEQKVIEAPSSVTIITSDEIRKYTRPEFQRWFEYYIHLSE